MAPPLLWVAKKMYVLTDEEICHDTDEPDQDGHIGKHTDQTKTTHRPAHNIQVI